MRDNTIISLELLLLNDLLRSKVIDETIYNLASRKIVSGEEHFINTQQPAIAATA